MSLGENESEVEHFDSQIFGGGGGGGEMIDDPMELAFNCRVNQHGRLAIMSCREVSSARLGVL